MSITVNKWDIWYAEIAFEQNPSETKKRPVLILEDGQMCLIDVAPITSHKPREYDLFDYEVINWR